MKRLVVMRHAKAVSDAGAGDHARVLTDRGRRDAAAMAQRLRSLGWAPDLVLCSDAARTLETWERMAQVLERPQEVHVDRRLYLTGADAVATVLHDLGDRSSGTVMVVGHNPGWEQLVIALCGREEELPTAAAALLEREGADPWYRSVRSGWRLEALLRPKDD